MKKKFLKISLITIFLVSLIGIVLLFVPVNSATINPRDWSQMEEDASNINASYSYSTIFLSGDKNSPTKFIIYKQNDKTVEKTYDFDTIKNKENYTFDITPDKSSNALIMRITNCAVNANGEMLDVVINIHNVKAFTGHSDDGKVQFRIDDAYSTVNQKNPAEETKGHSVTQKTPLMFVLLATYAQADFTMTYYKAGTYNQNNNSGTLGGVNNINGFYYDIDVVADTPIDDAPFNGNEGIMPKGASTIYYEENDKNANANYAHELRAENGGIYIFKNSENNVNAIYYESSALILTETNNSTFTFTYSGTNCGINYMYASPYPFQISNPSKSRSIGEINAGETPQFEYKISQYIPNNFYGSLFGFGQVYDELYETTKYKSVIIKDTINNNLSIDNSREITIVDETGDATAKEYFTVETNGNTITATAKANVLQNDPGFYAHTYTITVPVIAKADISSIDQICNKATTTSVLQKKSNDIKTESNTDNVCVDVRYSLTVNYYEKNTTTRVDGLEPDIMRNLEYAHSYRTNYEKVNTKKWRIVDATTDADEYSEDPSSHVISNINIKKNTIVNYYFEKIPYTLTVNYLEEGTNKPVDNLPADVTNPIYYDDHYDTNYDKVNLKKWTLTSVEVVEGEGTKGDGSKVSGTIKGNTTVNYYFKKIPYTLTVNYYGTDQYGATSVIEKQEVTKPIYYDDTYGPDSYGLDYRTTNINLKKWRIVRSEVEPTEGSKYTKDETTQIVNGTILGDTIVNYYFELIPYPVTVNYYDAETREKIAESDKTIYYFDMLYYTNYDKIDMEVWEYVSTDGDPVEGRITGDQESYTINYYFERLKYQLTVNYYDDETKEKIDKSDRAAYNYGDEYDTNYDKIDENYWEYVRTEGDTPGVIYEDEEVDYYFKNKEYTLEVNYYDEETGEKIEDPDISSHKFGEEYTTNDDKIDKKKWELVEEPANKEGTIEDDTEVNYYYRRRKYKITVNYYEEGTEDKIIESRENEAYYGDKYITDYNGVDEDIWTLVSMPENYQGEVDGDIVVNYYFKQVVIENPPTGSAMLKIIIPSIIMVVLLTSSIVIYRIYIKKKLYKI